MSRRAVVYARLSRKPEQDGNIAQQLQRGREHVERRDWTLVGSYKDDGITAYRDDVERPGWNDVLEACVTGRADTIVARDSARLYRNWEDHTRVIRSGAMIATWAEGTGDPQDPDDTEAGIRALMNRAYSKSISKNVRLAEDRRVEEGLPPRGGRRPWGFHSGVCCDDCKSHQVKDDEADVIREVADRWLAGETLSSLAADLNERGIRTTAGNRWVNSTLKRALMAPRLAGIRVYRGKQRRGSWEPIFTKEQYRALLEANSRSKYQRPAEHFLLRGLIRCGVCGKLMQGQRHGNKKPYRIRRYRCPLVHNGIAADAVDAFVWNVALGHKFTIDQASGQDVAERLRDTEREIARTQGLADRLDDDYWDQQAVTERTYKRKAKEFAERIEALSDEVNRLRRERQAEENRWVALMRLAEEHEVATWQERRLILEGVVEAVVVEPSGEVSADHPLDSDGDPFIVPGVHPNIKLSRVGVLWR